MKILFFIIMLLFSLLGILFTYQSKLLFYPTSIAQEYVFKFDLPFEEKFISYGDKQILHGLLFKPVEAKARILYFHGNGGSLDSWGFAGEELAKKTASEVLIIDYPGFGKSSAGLATSENALLESAQAAFKTLDSNSKLPLILYGRSLGSGIASFLAKEAKVDALILETPYTSIKAMAEVAFPMVPSFLVRYDLDNQKNIQNLKLPILIFHGTSDSVIPYKQAQLLNQQKKNIQFISIHGGNHNNLSEFPEYWDGLKKFVRAIYFDSQPKPVTQ